MYHSTALKTLFATHFSTPTSNKADNPFEAKPKLARHTPQTKSKSYADVSGDKIQGMQPLSQQKSNETSEFTLLLLLCFVVMYVVSCTLDSRQKS